MSATIFSDRGGTVVPGFVDLQVNGGFGRDFTAEPESIWEVAARLPRFGVTAFLPTLTSAPLGIYVRALEVLRAGPPPGWSGARPLGLHLEGPMIALDRRGTHPADALLAPTLELAEHLIAEGPPLMATVAPELAGAQSVVKRLVMAGTFVSLGHSGATAAQAAEAFGWGASHVTHLFNAMSGLHHRSPGLAAAALADDRVTVGLIADGVHVAPTMLRLAWRALGPTRIALVTDAMAAMGMGDGSYRIGSVPVEVRGGEVRNAEGNLAGSAATMDQLMRTMMRATGCSLEEAVVMASATPAEVVGHVPEPGDRVLLNTDLQVVAVSVGGKVVHGEVAQ